MLKKKIVALISVAFATAMFLSGCQTSPSRGESSVSQAGGAGADPTASSRYGQVGPGMNSKGEVIDSSKVESGYGQTVKGIRDYEGEITGRPAANSKFTKLEIGMPLKQVTDLIGEPTDQGAYLTGKTFIPFYFGGDRYRHEYVYKGQGRLIFAGGSMGDISSGHLIWIIHNSTEGGYR